MNTQETKTALLAKIIKTLKEGNSFTIATCDDHRWNQNEHYAMILIKREKPEWVNVSSKSFDGVYDWTITGTPPADLKIFNLTHSHKYGETVYYFQSENSLKELINNEDKISKLFPDLEYDEDLGEGLSIGEVDLSDMPTFKLP